MDKAEKFIQKKLGKRDKRSVLRLYRVQIEAWLDEYANEVSREIAIEFALSFDVDLLHKLSPDDIWKKYDLWLKQQEGER